MMPLKNPAIPIILAILLCCPSLQASGTYPPSVPLPPSSEGRVDYERYAKGKKIFTGKANLQKHPADDKIKARLEQIAKLLQKDKVKLDIETLSLTLDETLLQHLEYYLEIRYKLNVK